MLQSLCLRGNKLSPHVSTYLKICVMQYFFPSDSLGIQTFSPDSNLIQTKSFLGDITRDDTFCFRLDH